MSTPDASTVADPADTRRDRARPRRDATAHEAQPGTSVGRYLVIDRIGAGGMGVVLRAYDPKLQREVALKMVRTDRMAPDTQARIVREARAMAKISHPNVVAVYDVELEAASVVLAMEYVQGEDLEAWLRAERTWAEIVEVFAAAGRGLAQAHAAGLLHRDFKPANVLVGLDGRPRVTDFGLARTDTSASRSGGTPSSVQTGSRAGGTSVSDRTQPVDDSADAPADDSAAPDLAAEDTLDADLTAEGTVMGTPAFMAPEQHRSLELDAAADQYAFCISLRTALAGRLPFTGSLFEITRAKLSGPPPWPSSTRVPRRITAAIDRGMAPDPEQRWPSMSALLAELDHEPGRRRRAGVLVLGALAGGAVVSLAMPSEPPPVERCTGAAAQLDGVWDDARRAEVGRAIEATALAFADASWSASARALDDYATRWIAMHTEACEATDRGEQSSEVMDLRMTCLQRARGQLRATVDVLAGADASVLTRAHDLVDGLPDLELCADVESLRTEVPPPSDPELAKAVEAGHERLAEVEASSRAGKVREAAEQLEALADSLAAIDYAPFQVEHALSRGRVRYALGDTTRAEQAGLEALDGALARGQWRAAWKAARILAYAVGQGQGRHREAMAYVAIVMGLSQRGSVSAGDEATSRTTKATILRLLGELEAAEAELRTALARQRGAAGESPTAIAVTHNNLANTLYFQGKYAEAIAEHDRARELYASTLGDGHPMVARSLSNRASVLAEQGRLDQALADFRAALEIEAAALGPRHPQTIASRNNLAVALMRKGELAPAAAALREVIADSVATLGEHHPRVGGARANLGFVLIELERLDEAEVELQAAIESITQSAGAQDLMAATAWEALAHLWLSQERPTESESAARSALEIRLQAQGADHPDVAGTRELLGRAVLAQGHRERARAIYEEALRVAAASEASAGARAELARALAELLWPSEPSRAIELVTQARAALPQDPSHAELRQALDAWLAAHGPEARD